MNRIRVGSVSLTSLKCMHVIMENLDIGSLNALTLIFVRSFGGYFQSYIIMAQIQSLDKKTCIYITSK